MIFLVYNKFFQVFLDKYIAKKFISTRKKSRYLGKTLLSTIGITLELC